MIAVKAPDNVNSVRNRERIRQLFQRLAADSALDQVGVVLQQLQEARRVALEDCIAVRNQPQPSAALKEAAQHGVRLRMAQAPPAVVGIKQAQRLARMGEAIQQQGLELGTAVKRMLLHAISLYLP